MNLFRVLIEPRKLLALLWIVLVAWTITDCVRRKEHGFWVVIILLFPYVGPLLYLAWTRNWIGRLTEAGERKRAQVIDVEPSWGFAGDDTPAALQRKGEQLLRHGHHEQAVEVLEDLLEREGPGAPLDVRYNIALAYKALERYRDARDQLSLIVGEDPKFRAGQAFLELADCHVQMGDEKQALNLFEQLLRVIRFPEARYHYGLLLDSRGETKAATEQMRLLLSELDQAPEFHRRSNRRYGRLAKKYVRRHR